MSEIPITHIEFYRKQKEPKFPMRRDILLIGGAAVIYFLTPKPKGVQK